MKERDIRGVEYSIEINHQEFKAILQEPLPEPAKELICSVERFCNEEIGEIKSNRANVLFNLYYTIRDNNLSKKDILQTINNIYKEYADEDVE